MHWGKKKLTVWLFSFRCEGFPLLFSALRASPLPPQSTTSTLASYCSAMHNTSARLLKGISQKKWHHWRNRLWRAASKRWNCPRRLPRTMAKAPFWARERQHQKKTEMTVVWTACCKLGRCENKWNVRKAKSCWRALPNIRFASSALLEQQKWDFSCL